MKKLVTFYSDSHAVLYEDFFLKSFLKNIKDCSLKTKKVDQLSPTGEWASEKFNVVTLEKIRWILTNIDLNDSNNLIYADCDVQFLNDINVDLGEHDILFQKDYDNICSGFFICKQNERIKYFFENVEKELAQQIQSRSTCDDQWVINQFLTKSPRNKKYLDLKFGYLPSDEYWTVGNSLSGKVWVGQDFVCPGRIVVHHANFTIGIERKINLMKIVKQKLGLE